MEFYIPKRNNNHESAVETGFKDISIEQQIESLRIKLQSGSYDWIQRSNKFHNSGEYWQKLNMLDNGKYRLCSERSLHLSAG